MSKTRKPRRRAATRRTVRERAVDVVTQLETAARHPRAALLGALLGGSVPWFARVLAHDELPAEWASGGHGRALVMLAIILGCAAFSMLTVYKFGLAAFGDARKAIGFVAALEGVMLVSHGATSTVALLLLVVINAIANGCVIALGRDATLRRKEADERRSATRRARGGRSRPAAADTTSPASPEPIAPTPAAAPRSRARRSTPIVVVHAAAPDPRRALPARGRTSRDEEIIEGTFS